MRQARRLSRAIAGAFSLVIGLSAAPMAFGADEAPPWSLYARPQRLVPLPDGRRINLICLGEGSPVVIFESGLGDPGAYWGLVQPQTARTTRTCAYDRAGLGFSDEGPAPRDAAAVAADLSAMLEGSGLKGPYVLVGHSLGSFFVRLFADLHPDQVAGMVLVDPSVEFQTQRSQAVVTSSHATPPQDPSEWARKCVAAAQAGELKPGAAAYKECTPGAPPGLPPDLVAAFMAPYAAAPRFRTIESERESMDLGSAQLDAHRRSYGAIPLIVLTAGQRPKQPGETVEERQALLRLWIQMHDELAALSSRGENRMVKESGHYMHLERPQVVIDAVNEAVAAVRQGAGGTVPK